MYQLVGVGVLIVAALHTAQVESWLPQCTRSSKPCRMKTVAGDESYEVALCTCSGSRECGDAWDDPTRVLSRRVPSDAEDITYHLKFCQELVPSTECTSDSYAVILKGDMYMPDELVEQRCRCPSGQLLILASTSTEHYETLFSFKCEEHVGDCRTHQNCMVNYSDRTDFVCKCPMGQFCGWGGLCQQ